MLRRALLALPLLLTSHDAALAQSVPEQAFIEYHAALEIDSRCHFLRYLELTYLQQVEFALMDPLPFREAYDAKTIDENQYQAARNKLADMGKNLGRNIACTDEQAAAPFILRVRDLASTLIYADLMIAFQAAELSEEQQRAGQAFEAMIAPLYGENWPNFLEAARQRAQFRIDQSLRAAAEADPFGGLINYDSELDAEMDAYGLRESNIYFDGLVSEAAKVLDTILFDLLAGDAGLRVRREGNFDTAASAITLADAAGARVYELIDSPARYETLERTAEVPMVLAVTQSGDLRVLTWGDESSHLQNGSMAVLVHRAQLPTDQASNYSYLRSADWWDGAEIFNATRVDEPCLGGPCFALPAGVLDGIVAGAPNQAFRFFISDKSQPELPKPDDLRIHTGFTYALDRWRAFKADEAQ